MFRPNSMISRSQFVSMNQRTVSHPTQYLMRCDIDSRSTPCSKPSIQATATLDRPTSNSIKSIDAQCVQAQVAQWDGRWSRKSICLTAGYYSLPVGAGTGPKDGEGKRIQRGPERAWNGLEFKPTTVIELENEYSCISANFEGRITSFQECSRALGNNVRCPTGTIGCSSTRYITILMLICSL